ncbi:MAG: transposase [Bradyrhizobium sp.]|nr:transposase [Bradyrhizobium sp.]
MTILAPNNLVSLAHKRFTDAEEARKHLEELCWPDGPVCPRCSGNKAYHNARRHNYKCANSNCYHQFSVTSGTIFHCSKLPLNKWLHATHLFGNQREFHCIERVAREIGVNYRTAQRISVIMRPSLPGRAKRSWSGGSKQDVLCYPFLPAANDRTEHDLLRRVNEVVSRNITPDRRADICQDLIVGLLSGEFGIADLEDRVSAVSKAVFRLHPERYAPVSLDANLDDSDATYLDRLADEDRDWA